MTNQIIFCGEDILEVELPKGTFVPESPKTLNALKNPLRALNRALEKPIEQRPLKDLLAKAKKVTIAFDDPCLPFPPMEEPDARAIFIPRILEMCADAGIADSDVRLICANGLHRKWRRDELGTILSKELVFKLGKRLTCHDAEDPDGIVNFGETPEGYEIVLNRCVKDSDLVIYVNVNWTSMNGGWKSVMVGLGTYKSIRHHHNPAVLSSEHSFMDPDRAPLQGTLWKMGSHLENLLGSEKFFQIETVVNNNLPYQIAGVFAGRTAPTHKKTLELVFKQQNVRFDEAADILIYGLPEMSPYAAHAGMNPILVYNLGLGYVFHLYRGKPLVKKDGILVIANPLQPDFDDEHHPSYRDFFENVLKETRDQVELSKRFEEGFAANPEYIDKYRNHYGYHGVHPFYVYYWAGHAMKHLKKVYIAPTENDWVAERLGLTPVPSLDEAISLAKKESGEDSSCTFLPVLPIIAADLDGS